ncbi:hypothetical protein HK098_002006 [Nowakowskiella sp. JEL0407]|nr:hypothetical protein HK098_002006 [Nowakowskiella sp. JEL0407]
MTDIISGNQTDMTILKPACQYGFSCYRQKNPKHVAVFSHLAPTPYDNQKSDAENTSMDTSDSSVDLDDDESVTLAGRRKRRAATKRKPDTSAKASFPGVLLAHSWTEDIDPKNYWMSEKLDGIRAIYDPYAKTFRSRNGNEFFAPDFFVKGYPTDMYLDGELFCGRGKFREASSIVRSHSSPKWNEVVYKVFDSPTLPQRFEQRMEKIKDWVSKNKECTTIEVVEQIRVLSKQHVLDKLEEVEGLGGEGLMLRQPKSFYEGTRSKTLLKVKSFYDAEAIVEGHKEGSGKNVGLCGALLCKMENGTKFKIGSGLTDNDRRKPPKKGAIVTYRFQELTADGVPRFPTFVGVRIDATGPKDAVITKGTVVASSNSDEEDEDNEEKSKVAKRRIEDDEHKIQLGKRSKKESSKKKTYVTFSGNFCTGGTFTTVLADYGCNSETSRITVTTSNCILYPAVQNCFSPTTTYKTATVSEVIIFGPVSSPCYNPLDQAKTMYEVIVFQTGSVNGVVATIEPKITTTTTTAATLSPTSTPAATSSDNTIVIIIAVVAGLVLLIVIVVAFLVLKRMKKGPQQETQQPFLHQQYPPQGNANRDGKVASLIYPPYANQPPSVYSTASSATYPPNQMSPQIHAAMLAPITTQGIAPYKQ